MANEKRLIDANALRTDYLKKHRMTDTEFDICYPWWQFSKAIENAPTVDAVEVDTVIEMFEYMLGDCPCNFSPVDEWLAERCELQEECPNPKDKRGCWKQFIKHYVAEMDGDGNG